jgi:hypothetical protein
MHLLSALSIRSWQQPSSVVALSATFVARKRRRESVRDR